MRRPEFWTIFGSDEQICGRYNNLRDARDCAHECEMQANHDGSAHTIVKVILIGRAAKTGRRPQQLKAR